MSTSGAGSGVENTFGDGVYTLGGCAGIGSGGKGALGYSATSTSNDSCNLGDKATGGRVGCIR